MEKNNRKLPFQSPPPNKIIYQDDYSSPQLVFLPQTPESSGQSNNKQRPIRFDKFDDDDDLPLTPIVSSNTEDVEIITSLNCDLDELDTFPSSSDINEDVRENRTSNEQPNMKGNDFSPKLEKQTNREDNEDSFSDEREHFQQRIDVNDRVSIKNNNNNKMMRMVDEEEYDDPFAHVPETNEEDIQRSFEAASRSNVSIKEEEQTTNSTNFIVNSSKQMATPKSSSPLPRSKTPVEEYVFERDNEYQEVELVEVKSSKKFQDRFSNLVTGVEKFGNKLLSPANSRDSMRDGSEEHEIASDKKKMLSDERGNRSAAMSGLFEKMSTFKLNSSLTIETSSSKDQVPPEEEEEEDSFLSDIILSSSHNQNMHNKQPYLPNSNVSPQTTPTNSSFMNQSWVEKLKRTDINAEAAREFFVSCQESDFDSVRSFIEEKNLNVNIKDVEGYGQTALHYACWNGCSKMVEYLLSKEASINALNDYKQTPLHVAAFRGHADIVSLLLKSGADKSCIDHVGETALDYAKKKRNEATNFTSESLYKDVIKTLDSHIENSNPRKRKAIPCCFQ